ncbi:MAG: choice-of-anchor Q domain-containing protein [candidate division WOR-3 bacterium]
MKSNSPGINAGDSLSAPAIDLEGKSRPQGGNVDIGCYEQ